jgi:hypothetical protein
MADQGFGHIYSGGLLQSFPAGDSVDLEYVGLTVAIDYKIDPGVVRGHGSRSPDRQTPGLV